jgi:hypothetical protein
MDGLCKLLDRLDGMHINVELIDLVLVEVDRRKLLALMAILITATPETSRQTSACFV